MASFLPGKGLVPAGAFGIDRRAVTYLVDANVLSELTKPDPDPQVVVWLRAHEKKIVIDPIILGELRFGVLLLPAGKRRQRLEAWFESGISKMTCLPWEATAGLRWTQLLAKLRSEGRSMPLKDSLIAATALLHDLTIVTRNTSDFTSASVRTLDPFS